MYMLKAGFIEKVSSVKDIGVTIQSNLKFTIHCTEIVRKAYFVVRSTLNSFRNHDCTFYLKVYTTYVRQILLTRLVTSFEK